MGCAVAPPSLGRVPVIEASRISGRRGHPSHPLGPRPWPHQVLFRLRDDPELRTGVSFNRSAPRKARAGVRFFENTVDTCGRRFYQFGLNRSVACTVFGFWSFCDRGSDFLPSKGGDRQADAAMNPAGCRLRDPISGAHPVSSDEGPSSTGASSSDGGVIKRTGPA